MFSIYIRTYLIGQKVGEDAQGNVYYMERAGWWNRGQRRVRRWVLYKGAVEASKVPAAWHAWLHYGTDEIPVEKTLSVWQKAHLPNLTGTRFAYFPVQRKKVRQSYESWTPMN